MYNYSNLKLFFITSIKNTDEGIVLTEGRTKTLYPYEKNSPKKQADYEMLIEKRKKEWSGKIEYHIE
jgi:hypothetical protein